MGIGLKTVPKVVPPNLLKLLGEMRNGEQVGESRRSTQVYFSVRLSVFADRGFPSATLCSRIGGPTEIRVDGIEKFYYSDNFSRIPLFPHF
jgi:hypothetical protein